MKLLVILTLPLILNYNNVLKNQIQKLIKFLIITLVHKLHIKTMFMLKKDKLIYFQLKLLINLTIIKIHYQDLFILLIILKA